MLGVDGHVVIGPEVGEFARVALVVAEVRPVAVEDDEELLCLAVGNDALDFVEQLHVMPRRVDVDQMLRLAGQLVNHGPLGRLVGDEPRLETRFAEECRDALAAVELLVLVGGDGGENQRNALVGRIALGEHVAERDDAVGPQQHGVRFAVVAPQLPVHGA